MHCGRQCIVGIIGLDEPSLEADAGMDGDDDTSRRTTEIRMEIEETRAELAETVDAIEQKLRPSAVVARAAERSSKR